MFGLQDLLDGGRCHLAGEWRRNGQRAHSVRRGWGEEVGNYRMRWCSFITADRVHSWPIDQPGGDCLPIVNFLDGRKLTSRQPKPLDKVGVAQEMSPITPYASITTEITDHRFDLKPLMTPLLKTQYWVSGTVGRMVMDKLPRARC